MTTADLAAACREFVSAAVARARDGLTLAEFSELAVELLRLSVSILDSIPSTGQQKKQMALEAVELLFDSVADKCVPAIAWPVWLIVKPAARQLVLLAAAGALEAVLPMVRAAQ